MVTPIDKLAMTPALAVVDELAAFLAEEKLGDVRELIGALRLG